jgi:8-oxo-dGTP diphosphatase
VVLVFLRRHDKVLMGFKKTGFGQGKYVAIGGHIEVGESPEEAAKREFFEETNARLVDLALVARVEFVFSAQPEWNMHACVFESFACFGKPFESAEIAPIWFKVATLPYSQMWDDGRYWVQQMLDGSRFDARMVYAADNQTVQSAHLEPWDETRLEPWNVQNRVTKQKKSLE